MARGKARNKEKVIEAVRPYLQLGYSVHKACKNACIPQSTFQTWVDKDDDLRSNVISWQNRVSSKAREVVAKDINTGDVGSAKWWLERQERKEFGNRPEVDDDSQVTLINIEKQIINIANEQEPKTIEAVYREGTSTDDGLSIEPIQEREGRTSDNDPDSSDDVRADIQAILSEN